MSFENEWIDLEGLRSLAAEGVRFLPSLEALAPLICKRSQRELQQRLQLPAPRWFPLEEALPPPPPVPTSGPPEAASSGADPAAPGVATAVLAPPVPQLPPGFL